MKIRGRRFLYSSICALSLVFGLNANAQSDFPDKPIRIIVPYPAGGVVDSLSRVIGNKLSAQYGQPVVVENKSGAGGAIGTEHVAKSSPDGYTLLMVSPSFAVAPLFQKSIAWDPVRDFKGVAEFGAIPNVIVVNQNVPAKTLPEFIALSKKSAAPSTYASSGIGTSSFLAGELLVQMAKVPLTHVPYKGQPDAVNDLLTGRVDMMPMSTSLAIPHIKAGKLRPLAVTTQQRSFALADVPTVAEAANLPGYDVATWLALVAPAKTPQAILHDLSEKISQIILQPDVQKKMHSFAIEGPALKGPEFDRMLESEVTKWSNLVKKSGINLK